MSVKMTPTTKKWRQTLVRAVMTTIIGVALVIIMSNAVSDYTDRVHDSAWIAVVIALVLAACIYCLVAIGFKLADKIKEWINSGR